MKAFRYLAAALAGSLCMAPAVLAATAEAGVAQPPEAAPARADGVPADSLRSVAPAHGGGDLLDDALVPHGPSPRGKAIRAEERARSWQSLLPGSIQ